MDEEMKKWSTKDRALILSSLLNPEFLEPLENGELKHLYQSSGEHLLSICETDSASIDNINCSTVLSEQNPNHKNYSQLKSANSFTDSQDENSKDSDLEFAQKIYIENNIDDMLHLQVETSQKNNSIFAINQVKDNIYEINQSSSSPVYELNDQLNNSPVYQFSLPSDSPIYQTDQQSKISSVYQFKQTNSNSNSCNSWSSNNSNISNSDVSANIQDNQIDSNFECLSNQRSSKRQKSFVGIIPKTDINTNSVVEVRRKLPVARSKAVSSNLQF